MTKQRTGSYCHKPGETKLAVEFKKKMFKACGSLALLLAIVR